MLLSNRNNRRRSAQPVTANDTPPFAYGLLHQLRPHKVDPYPAITLTLTVTPRP